MNSLSPSPAALHRDEHKRHLRHAVLGVNDVRILERKAIDAGISEVRMMHNAGRIVADRIQKHFDPCPTLVLCGPGNNGGDGYVVAQRLLEKGWLVKVATLDAKAPMPAAAAHHRMYWQGITVGMHPQELKGVTLVIDALFGLGLDRPIDGPYKEMIQAVNESRLDVISIDIASGVHGDTGAIMGAAISADMTITFGYRKRGQMLMPGRHHQGEIMVADIGLDAVEDATCFVNHPDLWLNHFPFPSYKDHKYTRGHALIFGGDEMTGASRLAAQASRRSGAGLVTLACSEKAYPIYALSLLGTLVAKADTPAAIDALLKDERINAVLIGCGLKPDAETRTKVSQVLKHSKASVLDAGALSAFESDPGALFASLSPRCVLTPHEGEFERLFQDSGDKMVRAAKAATTSNATIVLKGPDTVITQPQGTTLIQDFGPPWLATGGTGDVLSGFIIGFLAQGVPAFEAAAMSCWFQSEAALHFGPGLIAEDIAESFPKALRDFMKHFRK